MDKLQILISAALAKTTAADLNEKLKNLKIKPIFVPVELAKNAASTLNAQLKNLKIKSFDVPLSVSSKSIKDATKNLSTQMSGGNVSSSLDSTLKKINNFRIQLANIEQSAYGLAHPVIDTSNQEKLSAAYKRIDDSINTVVKSGQKMSAIEDINIKKQIADVERLRKSYVQSERGAQALEAKPITFDIQKTTAQLSSLEARWRNQGILTGNFKTQIDAIKIALSTVDDQEGLSKITQDLSLAKIKAGELNTELRKFNATIAQSTAKNKIDSYLNLNPKALAANRAGFNALFASIKNITNPAEQAKFNKLFASVTSGIDAMGKTGNTVFGSLLKNMQKFAGWVIASGGVMAAITSVKKMITNVILLDKALVDLRMATGGTYEETAKLIETYNALGQEIGATTVEIANSANSWLRQGMSIADTNTMIKNSMILSKVGMIDSATSTQYMTSAMKGYGVAVEDTLGIVDMLSGIDLVSATDAGGLAEAMSNTAASANIAGVSMSKLLSYLATVGEVTQREMSSIGMAFKTIFARMRDIKVGASLDEEGESLSNVESILARVDIKLRSSVGEFRDFGDVLDDVGAKWDSYSEVEQASIAKAFSGVRQQENFLVLMENYGKSLEYNEVAMTSNGVATEKMAAYDESLEASLKRLTAAFEGLSTTTVNGGFIKGAIVGGTSFLNILTRIIDTFGLLGTAGAAAMGVISAKGGGSVKMLTLKNMPPKLNTNGDMNELRLCA